MDTGHLFGAGTAVVRAKPPPRPRRRALVAEGWTITHDPLTLSFGGRDLFVDLGAERAPLAAEKAGRKIAVEIQGFLGASSIRDLHQAVGPFEVDRAILQETQPDRTLDLAVPARMLDGLFSERFGRFLAERLGLRLLAFDEAEDRKLV